MSGKRKTVSQDDLRKMMGKIKTGGASGTTSSSAASKRYKLSSRELQLIEEQKRREADEKSRSKAVKDQQRLALAQQLPPSDAKPVKSILKKSGPPSTPFAVPLAPSATGGNTSKPPTAGSTSKFTASSHDHNNVPSATPSTSLTTSRAEEKGGRGQGLLPDDFFDDPRAAGAGKAEKKGGRERAVAAEEEKGGGGGGSLPEGFFDDPVADARARGVAYVDKDEEEWEAFQKEMEAEASVAATILVEDRNEATVDRQIEEIDEQMQAWQRVNRLEKMKDKVDANRLKDETKTNNDTVSSVEAGRRPRKSKSEAKTEEDDDDSSEDDEDVSEFLDWRKKC